MYQSLHFRIDTLHFWCCKFLYDKIIFMLVCNCSALEEVLGAVSLAVYIPLGNREERTNYGKTNTRRGSKTDQNLRSKVWEHFTESKPEKHVKRTFCDL